MLAPKVVILYGNGGDLGNLDVFAKGIVKRLPATYAPKDVFVRHVILKADFFRLIETFPTEHAGAIAELHIVSHAIGAGLFPGYHVSSVSDRRQEALAKAIKADRRITYDEVVAAEVGAILTDDFLTSTVRSKAEKFRLAFAPSATIKLWGCNSGIARWRYSDNGETDPAVIDKKIPFYWRALNTKNSPKPAVAQAFADFFQRRTFGATSGAHVEVLHHGQWIKSSKYKAALHKWPSPSLTHRLHPDRGDYKVYNPGPMP